MTSQFTLPTQVAGGLIKLISPTQAQFGSWLSTLTPGGGAVVEFLSPENWYTDETTTTPGIFPLQDMRHGLTEFLKTASARDGLTYCTVSTGLGPLAHLFGQRVLQLDTLTHPHRLYNAGPDVWNITLDPEETYGMELNIKFCPRWYDKYVAGVRED